MEAANKQLENATKHNTELQQELTASRNLNVQLQTDMQVPQCISLPTASAVKVIKTEPSVCVSVSLCVCQLELSRLVYGHEIWYRD